MIDPFPLLLAGHALGDWVVQTDKQAAGKGWPRPVAEVEAAILAEPVDDNHPTPEADRRRAALSRPRWRSWRANQVHVATYTLTLAVCLVPLSNVALWRSLAALGGSWVLHSIIDRRWPVRWLMEHTGSVAFAGTALGMLAVDQSLHVATLGVMSVWIQAGMR